MLDRVVIRSKISLLLFSGLSPSGRRHGESNSALGSYANARYRT